MLHIVKPLLRRPLMPLLVVLQVALACAIACNALFLLQQKAAPLVAPDGIGDPGNLVFLHGMFPRGDPWPAAQLRGLEDELRGVPGVQGVGYAATLPMVSAAQFTMDVGKRDGHAGVSTTMYFGDHLVRMLGLRMESGRDFTPEEAAADIDLGSGRDGPVIITRALADRLFPDGEAVGKLLPGTNSPVVGVVAHLMRNKFIQGNRDLDYTILRPGVPKQWPAPMYAVRLATPDKAQACKSMLSLVQRALGSKLLPGQHIQCDAYPDLRDQMLAPQRAAVWLLSGVTLIVLVVTLTGIMGMTGYWVQQRTRSIGVRRALGAKRSDVLRELLIENLVVAAVGVVVGLIAACGINLWLMRHYELLRLPVVYLPLGAALLVALGQLAVLAPARRASRIPPIVATRAL